MQSSSVWDFLIPILGFFSQVGTGVIDTRDAPTTFGVPDIYYPESSPLVNSILHELKTGWSQQTIVSLWGPWYVVAAFFTLLFLSGILYCVIRITQIRRVERLAYVKATRPVEHRDIPRTQLRWQRILEEMQSDDHGKWRLAILEADIMLNELLDSLGYKGETMADKMKQIDISNFNTIDFAWEAHKIRNMVAHEGTKYELSEREARRVIRMYERVFREFNFID